MNNTDNLMALLRLWKGDAGVGWQMNHRLLRKRLRKISDGSLSTWESRKVLAFFFFWILLGKVLSVHSNYSCIFTQCYENEITCMFLISFWPCTACYINKIMELWNRCLLIKTYTVTIKNISNNYEVRDIYLLVLKWYLI